MVIQDDRFTGMAVLLSTQEVNQWAVGLVGDAGGGEEEGLGDQITHSLVLIYIGCLVDAVGRG